MIKGSIQEEDITIINIYAPNIAAPQYVRIDAFELWCWRRLLRVPWTAQEIQPVHSEGDQPWDFFGRNDAKAENSSTLATSCEELTHWKRL